MSDAEPSPYLFELFDDLPRQGPGSEASTLRALSMLAPLPDTPRILDVGCGAGQQTLVLARKTCGRVTAVDVHQPFLDRLAESARAAGLDDRVETRLADMNGLPFADASFDLIWSEGAVYIMGFAQGLRSWKRLLAPGGMLAVSEASWLSDDRPPEALEFWSEAYPAMNNVADNLQTIAGLGYHCRGHFTLPDDDWWTPCYQPLQEKLDAFEAKYKSVPEALQIVQSSRTEIQLFKNCSHAFGYVFYVLANA